MDLKFKATPELVKLIGEEWKGEYTVKQLSAPEVLKITDECIDELRKKGHADVFDIPKALWNYRLFLKAVLKDGKPIKKEPPAKLFELLQMNVLKLNSLMPDERRELFLLSTTDGPLPADSS